MSLISSLPLSSLVLFLIIIVVCMMLVVMKPSQLWTREEEGPEADRAVGWQGESRQASCALKSHEQCMY